MTQEQLAERIEVSRNFIGMLERGESGVTLETMLALAEAFDMTLSELFLGVHGKLPTRVTRVNAAVAGQPAEVQEQIFAIIAAALTLANR